MWWNILWAFLIPLGFIGISLAILALAFGKVKIPYWSASGSGATTSTNPIIVFLKSWKCWGGLAFLIVLNVALWILHSYTVQYIKINDPRPAFLMINLTAGIWILGLSLGAKFWGKLLMVALSWLFLGTGFAFYQQSPAEFKAQAAANEAIQSSDPFTKVIAEVEVPPGVEDELVWSEAVMLPDPTGPQFRARLAVPTAVRVYGPDGKELPDRSIKDSREDQVNFYGLPEGSTARFASLIPGQGGTLQFLTK